MKDIGGSHESSNQNTILSGWFTAGEQICINRSPVITATSQDGREDTVIEISRMPLLSEVDIQTEHQLIDAQMTLFRAQTAYCLERGYETKQGLDPTPVESVHDIGPLAKSYAFGGPVNYALYETPDQSVTLEYMTLYDLSGGAAAQKVSLSRIADGVITERYSILALKNLPERELSYTFMADSFLETFNVYDAWKADGNQITPVASDQINAMIRELS